MPMKFNYKKLKIVGPTRLRQKTDGHDDIIRVPNNYIILKKGYNSIVKI